MNADDLESWLHENEAGFLADLCEWLAIPSVQADPARSAEVRRSAEWLAGAFRAADFPTVEIWETDAGVPAVFAEWRAEDPAAPAVLVYGHHDVQPVDPEDLWETPPFEPRLEGERLFARGAADDKGQVAFHLYGVRAGLAVSGRSAPPVTLRFLVEGEEESGSLGFRALLERHRERLRSDVVVVSDQGMWSQDVPTICIGMRGALAAEIHLRGPSVDLHSGTFGGTVPNPLHVMAELLAGLHDDRGRVAVPGFYDRVAPIPPRERELFAQLPYDEDVWLTESASSAVQGEEGFTTLERAWSRPTCDVNGMWGGYTGPGVKTIVPAEAHAKLSFRLVAHQDPHEVREQLERFVQSGIPPGVEASLEFSSTVKPSVTDLEHPALQALHRAMEQTFGGEVLFTRDGGSGPEADLAEVLQAPVLFLGVGLPTDLIHAPNEHVVVPLLLKGASAAALLWEELAAVADHLGAVRSS